MKIRQNGMAPAAIFLTQIQFQGRSFIVTAGFRCSQVSLPKFCGGVVILYVLIFHDYISIQKLCPLFFQANVIKVPLSGPVPPTIVFIYNRTVIVYCSVEKLYLNKHTKMF